MDPYGGAMARAGATDTPSPHRAGNLYGVQYGVTWEAGEDGEARMAWLRALYAYMAPHVSGGPRAQWRTQLFIKTRAKIQRPKLTHTLTAVKFVQNKIAKSRSSSLCKL